MSVQLKSRHLLDYCTSPRNWHPASFASPPQKKSHEGMEGLIGTLLNFVAIVAFILNRTGSEKELQADSCQIKTSLFACQGILVFPISIHHGEGRERERGREIHIIIRTKQYSLGAGKPKEDEKKQRYKTYRGECLKMLLFILLRVLSQKGHSGGIGMRALGLML